MAALNLWFPLASGGFVFGIASGLAILRGAQLPIWLGWVAIVIGIVTVTPAMLVGLVAYFVWAVIAGVLMWKRSGAESHAPRAETPSATA